MPGGKLIFKSQADDQLLKLIERLKLANRLDLQIKLKRNIQYAAAPVRADVRRAAMGVRVTSTRGGTAPPVYSRLLRARVAAATKANYTKHGVRFVVSALEVGDYGTTLPLYLDSTTPRYRNWRHPVFYPKPLSETPANRITQQHGSPFFYDTIRRHAPKFRFAALEAVADIKKELNP